MIENRNRRDLQLKKNDYSHFAFAASTAGHSSVTAFYLRIIHTQMMRRWNSTCADPDRFPRSILILISSVCIDLSAENLGSLDTVIEYVASG